MLFEYHDETAGNPKSPIAMIKYNKSKNDNVMSRWTKVLVKLDVLRFETSTPILKTLPMIPIDETVIL